MRYHALATDYDFTIAEHSVVSDPTIKALERVRGSGRLLILVTGRELDDLLRVFPRIDLFDRVVAENGAVLYRPASREQRVLAEPPPAEFIRAVRAAGISPLCEGKVIVATLRPNEVGILGIIRDLGLELHVIFNHSAVMVLPSGTNKASGLQAALLELGLSPHNCVGVGDAENDHAFLSFTGCSVAVNNALDALKKHMDFVTRGGAGKGVEELIDHLLDSDLRFLDSVVRHQIPLGTRLDGGEVSIGSYDKRVLIAGTSGAGKSTHANSFRGFPPKGERQRHRRKYAEGELAPDLCFYFRGPDSKLNLRVQNLSVFLQIAEGVDEETWLFHLKSGDLSKWFRNVIKDEELASEIRKFESRTAGATESLAHIRSEIEKRYMVAA